LIIIARKVVNAERPKSIAEIRIVMASLADHTLTKKALLIKIHRTAMALTGTSRGMK
jgi:hypothetical protein